MNSRLRFSIYMYLTFPSNRWVNVQKILRPKLQTQTSANNVSHGALHKHILFLNDWHFTFKETNCPSNGVLEEFSKLNHINTRLVKRILTNQWHQCLKFCGLSIIHRLLIDFQQESMTNQLITHRLLIEVTDVIDFIKLFVTSGL